MTVNRIPMPKNRESAQDGSGITDGMPGSSNTEVEAPHVLDTHESTDRINADVFLPRLPGSILHANADGDIDISDGALDGEIAAGEDIFEEFYASRKELEQSTNPGMKSAKDLILPSNREIDGDTEAVPEVSCDSVGDQSAPDVFLAASTNIESSIGSFEMDKILKGSNCDLHAAASPADNGIKGDISSCNEMIDTGTNCIQKRADPPLRTICEWVGLVFCSEKFMAVLLIQTLLKQARSIRTVIWRCRSLPMFHL